MLTSVVGRAKTAIVTSAGQVDIFDRSSVDQAQAVLRGNGFQFSIAGRELKHLAQALYDIVAEQED